MSEHGSSRLSWVFVALLLVSAVVISQGGPTAVAGDHEKAHELHDAGNIISLSELLQRPELAGQRIIEAELEDEHGSLVYELELLGNDGRVYERYYDAVTGELLKQEQED